MYITSKKSRSLAQTQPPPWYGVMTPEETEPAGGAARLAYVGYTCWVSSLVLSLLTAKYWRHARLECGAGYPDTARYRQVHTCLDLVPRVPGKFESTARGLAVLHRSVAPSAGTRYLGYYDLSSALGWLSIGRMTLVPSICSTSEGSTDPSTRVSAATSIFSSCILVRLGSYAMQTCRTWWNNTKNMRMQLAVGTLDNLLPNTLGIRQFPSLQCRVTYLLY